MLGGRVRPADGLSLCSTLGLFASQNPAHPAEAGSSLMAWEVEESRVHWEKWADSVSLQCLSEALVLSQDTSSFVNTL